MVQKLERATALAWRLAQVRIAPLAWTFVIMQTLAMVQRLALVARDLVVWSLLLPGRSFELLLIAQAAFFRAASWYCATEVLTVW